MQLLLISVYAQACDAIYMRELGEEDREPRFSLETD